MTSELVTTLCAGEHPVEVALGPTACVDELRACIERGWVHIRFIGTRGGTELGVPLDRVRSDIPDASLASGVGRLRLVGELNLDYAPVRCIADIDVSTLTGHGRLELLADESRAS